jgi:hypothetical protein
MPVANHGKENVPRAAAADPRPGNKRHRMDRPHQPARPPQYALSLKQPWATLLVHGLKTIEVRRWPPGRQGPILIHAAKVSDDRAEAWSHVPPELLEDAVRLVGGIIGSGHLTGYRKYASRAQFEADQKLHLNNPAWFEDRGLYGFVFTKLKPLPFRRFPGWMRFFPVPE